MPTKAPKKLLGPVRSKVLPRPIMRPMVPPHLVTPLTVSPYFSVHTGLEVDNAVTQVVTHLSTATDLRTFAGLGTAALKNNGVASGVADLDSGGKVPTAQLPASVVGGLNYQGVWNASTNSPTLASGVGTKGYYYKVSVAGTTTIDGVNEWNVGDFIAYNGTTWDKIDNTEEDATSTVKGRVKLTNDFGGTADLPQVVGLKGDALPSNAANGFLKRNTGNTAWEEVAFGSAANTVCVGNDSRLSDSRAPSGTAGGDLSGTYPNPSLAGTAQALSPSFATLTDGATITWDLQSKLVSNATVTLGGARTLAFSNAVAGATGILKIKQDSTGSRTLALPSGSKVIGAGAGAISLTTAANSIDIASFYYDGTNYFWTIGLNFT